MRLLVVFARYPEPGSAKTRLIPRLGAEGAAALQRAMAEHAMRRVDGASDALEVRFEGGDAEGMRRWLGDRARYRPQGGGDLGERMLRGAHQVQGKGR